MSVLIKGMEMPTRCGRFDMCIREADGDIDYHYECCITAARIDNLGEKMEDCPLASVSPHGRLIDGDALKASLVFAEETAEWAVPALRAVLMVIDEMPTIIPAEEDET
jgi:hypothetical protein